MTEEASGFSGAVTRGFQWIGVGMITQAFLRIGVLAALTRMVGPKEFGLLGIALICTSCAERIGQVGVGPALVQKANVDDDDLRTATVLSWLSGGFIAVALWGLAPIVASIFREPQVTLVLTLLAVGFLVDSLAVVPDALLQRSLQFRALVRAETVSYVIGPGIVGVVGAWLGYGVWALVASHLTMKVVRVMLTRAAVNIPSGGRFTRKSGSALFAKGVGFSAGRILNFISLQGDNFVVGRVLGTEVLGLYTRAYQLMAIPAMFVGQLFERVLFPALAQKQHDLLSMRRAFQASVEVCAVVALPVSVLLFTLSREVVEILFGSRWLEIAPVLSILSLAVFFRTTYKCGDTVVRSKGEMARYTTRQIWYTLIVLGGSWIGAVTAGTIGVAWAVVLGITVNYILMIQLAAQLLELPLSALCRAHLPGVWFALCALLTAVWIAPMARACDLGPLFVVAIVGMTFIGWVGLSLLVGWERLRSTSVLSLILQTRRVPSV